MDINIIDYIGGKKRKTEPVQDELPPKTETPVKPKDSAVEQPASSNDRDAKYEKYSNKLTAMSGKKKKWKRRLIKSQKNYETYREKVEAARKTDKKELKSYLKGVGSNNAEMSLTIKRLEGDLRKYQN